MSAIYVCHSYPVAPLLTLRMLPDTSTIWALNAPSSSASADSIQRKPFLHGIVVRDGNQVQHQLVNKWRHTCSAEVIIQLSALDLMVWGRNHPKTFSTDLRWLQPDHPYRSRYVAWGTCRPVSCSSLHPLATSFSSMQFRPHSGAT